MKTKTVKAMKEALHELQEEFENSFGRIGDAISVIESRLEDLEE